MLHVTMTALLALGLAQEFGMVSPGGIQAIGPKQDDPLAMCKPGGGKSGIIVQGGREGIIVQGGREGIIIQGGREAFGGQSTNLAIGPKQDDPRSPGRLARRGDDNDPKAFGGQSTNLAIGPKQDDPRAPGVHAIEGGCGPTDGPIPAPK